MALPIRYRLGQQALSFKINALLTEPIADLWTSFFDNRAAWPKVKKYKLNPKVEKIRQQVIQLRENVFRTVTPPPSSTPYDLIPKNGVEAVADLCAKNQNPASKVSQMIEEIELEVEQLLLDAHESLWKTQVNIASLSLDNRVLRRELCSIKGTDGIGGVGTFSLMREIRSSRVRINELESSNKDLLLRVFPFDDPESRWKCNPKVIQHVANNISIAKQVFRDSYNERVSTLAEIGYAVRSRWMEQQYKSGKNRSTIMSGNEAAHHGFAVADSWLYHPDHNDGRNDVSSYIEQYGMSPARVYQLRNCKDLMTLLSWYGSVKSFHTPKSFPQSPFAKAWPRHFFEKYGKGDIEVARAAFSDGKQHLFLGL